MSDTATLTVTAAQISEHLLANPVDGYPVDPSNWRYRDHLTEVIERALRRTSNLDLTAWSDEDLNSWFVENMREVSGMTLAAGSPDRQQARAAWLRAGASWALAQGAEPEPVPDGWPVAAEREYVGSISAHRETAAALRVWADDGVDDVQDGVDAQSTYLREAGMSPCCYQQGSFKDFLGAVMRYKTALLGALPTIPNQGDEAQGKIIGKVYEYRGEDPSQDYEFREVTRVRVIRADRSFGLVVQSLTPPGIGWDASLYGWYSEYPMLPQKGYQFIRPRYLHEVDGQSLTEPTPEPTEPEDNEARLRRELADARNKHIKDIEIIGEALLREAERRNWCSEYDEVVDNINARLSVPLPERNQERSYTVTWTETYTVTVPRSYMTDALDADAAIEHAENGRNDDDIAYYLREAVNAGSYTLESDDDWEAEED